MFGGKKGILGQKMRAEAPMWRYLSLSGIYISSGLNIVPMPALPKKINHMQMDIRFSPVLCRKGGMIYIKTYLDISTQTLVVF